MSTDHRPGSALWWEQPGMDPEPVEYQRPHEQWDGWHWVARPGPFFSEFAVDGAHLAAPTQERPIATETARETHLRDGSTLYRYRYGRPGHDDM